MPLVTTFSVCNLARNNEFDYSKAENELCYNNRRVQRNLDVLTPMKKHYSYPLAA